MWLCLTNVEYVIICEKSHADAMDSRLDWLLFHLFQMDTVILVVFPSFTVLASGHATCKSGQCILRFLLFCKYVLFVLM